MFTFSLDMSAATRCRSAGFYRPCRNLTWFIVTGLSIASKLPRNCTAASPAWHTHVGKDPKPFTA